MSATTETLPLFSFSMRRPKRPFAHKAVSTRVWSDRKRTVWSCGKGTMHPGSVATADGFELCPRCDWDGHQTAPSMVYLGRASDGVVKVGCTTALAGRLHVQGLVHVDSAPGSFAEELTLIRSLGRAVRGREWFDPTPERMALAGTFLAELRAHAS